MRLTNRLALMNWLRVTALCPLLIVLLVGLPALSPANGKENQNHGEDDIVVVSAEQVIERDFFARAERIEISGTVRGDVYVAGGQIIVDGTVEGDILAVGGTITISGTVTQDARIAGGQVIINGEIGRNATIAGGSIELTPKANIRGGIVVGGGSVHIAGPVGSNARIAAGSATLANRIDGDVDAAVGALRLTSRAVVTGDLSYWSEAQAEIDEKAEIVGELRHQQLPEDMIPFSEKAVKPFIAGFVLLVIMMDFISMLILGLLMIRFYPQWTKRVVSHIQEQPLSTVGLGVVALLLTPVMSLLLAITVVGIPIALILLAWLAIALYLGRIFVIIWAGRFLFTRLKRAEYERLAFVTALVLYALVTLIPILGWLVAVFVILLGLGSVLFMKAAIYRDLRERDMI